MIRGGRPLVGEVTIGGAKNAAVAILPATVMARGRCVIENVPDISDVRVLLDILSQLGAKIEMLSNDTVAIDTTITAELEEEGLVRELKRKLQTMRKAAGFDVTDRIRVSYKASGKVKALFEKFAEDIASAVLADAIEEREPSGYVDSKSIQGEDAVIGVEKI